MRLEISQGGWTHILAGTDVIYKGEMKTMGGINIVRGKIESVGSLGLEITDGITIRIPKGAKLKFNQYNTQIDVV